MSRVPPGVVLRRRRRAVSVATAVLLTAVAPLAGAATTIPAAGLPAFSFVAPNACNDTHDCPVTAGDR